jgi:hypothetical protein
MKKQFTKSEIIAWAIGRLGGKDHYVDLENIVVFLFKHQPAIFSMRNFPEYPDKDTVSSSIRGHLSHDPVAFIKRLKPRVSLFSLTNDGIVFIKEHDDKIATYLNLSGKAGEKRIADSINTQTAQKVAISVIRRIREAQSFKQGSLPTVGDFIRILKVRPHEDHVVVARKKSQYASALEMLGAPGKPYLDFFKKVVLEHEHTFRNVFKQAVQS